MNHIKIDLPCHPERSGADERKGERNKEKNAVQSNPAGAPAGGISER